MFMELMEKRRKHFVALRAQEKRNRPPTKAQKRIQMSISEMKRVNTFVAIGSKVQESKEKKEESRKETTKGSRKKMLGRKKAVEKLKRQQGKISQETKKVEEEKESEEIKEDNEVELKKLLVIKKDEDIAIEAIPLATK
ncbi:hypothetical protein Tco_1235174 [Tanacetum coccineum]